MLCYKNERDLDVCCCCCCGLGQCKAMLCERRVEIEETNCESAASTSLTAVIVVHYIQY